MKKNFHEICVVTYCPFCGKAHEIEVNEIDYLDWKDGMLAQEAFPYLSADEREMLISGICPDCWNGMFGQEEEDEDSLDDEDFDDEYAEGFAVDLDMGFDPYLGCYTDDC
jgi:hypothetical protein